MSVVGSANVTLNIDGVDRVFQWTEFADQLTKYNCEGSICTTSIASNASLDIFWLIFAAVLVFIMQSGFTLLEVGSVSRKNTKNILTKNLGDAAVGAICFYSLGYGFALVDGNGFIGDAGFFTSGSHFEDSDIEGRSYAGYNYAFWLFQWAFAATAATIVSGAVAERVTFLGYFTYSFFLTIFIYPVVVHWGWSGTGWASAFKGEDLLFDVGVIDFAGSGVVHLTGGVAALVGSIAIGPRMGRFDGNGRPVELPQQSVVFQTIGTLILWFGWYGFNCGSTLTLQGQYADVAAKTAVTTTISAAMGGISTIIWGKLFLGHIDPALGNNGILAGLVGITAGCSTVDPEGALVIGFISSIVYFSSSQLLLKLKIDDVVDAAPVHMFCGIWGVLATGLFATEDNYKMAYSDLGDKTPCGLFYKCNGNSGKQFGANAVFVLAVIGWVGGCAAILFFSLKFLGLLRVPEDVERLGLDISEHGGKAYPSDSITGPTIDSGVRFLDYEKAETPNDSA